MTADHTLPPPNQWVGREIAPDDYENDWEAWRRQKKTDWPSHLAEIVHTYNTTHSAVTRYNPHYLMFGQWPRFPINFYFPTIGGSEAPTRKASTKHVDDYIASVQERLRPPMGGASPIDYGSMPTKWYYDRKIAIVNLKPGNLVLVKADTFKGKRKIQDRWAEETWEVVHHIATDVTSYKVTSQHGKSCILHQNQLLLVASEVGVPLCIGIHHAWDRCTSPHPMQAYLHRG